MKTLHWVGPSLRDLRKLPASSQDKFGHALYLALMGGRHPDAKPFKGFKSAHAPDEIEERNGNTANAAYFVRFNKRVYVLHAAAMKPKRGVKPETDPDLIRRRLAEAISDATRD